MQPSTPPPPKSVLLAALTMASTRILVMSPRTIFKGMRAPPFLSLFQSIAQFAAKGNALTAYVKLSARR